ncbi:MAG: hypothetical protein ACRDOD_05885 [Streptosporangiaceae bacterium]
MKFSYHQGWALRRLGHGLRLSDPHLAAMLTIFARLTAGEAIASREQARPAGDRIRRGLLWLGYAMAAVVACISTCVRQVLHRAARACVAVRSWFSGNARISVSLPPAVGSAGDSKQ